MLKTQLPLSPIGLSRGALASSTPMTMPGDRRFSADFRYCHLLSSVKRFFKLSRHERPRRSLLAFARDDVSIRILSITERPSLFPHSFTRSNNSVPYGSPAINGNTTGLPCSTCISERGGPLYFAGGTTFTMDYWIEPILARTPFGSSLAASLACLA